MKMAVAHFFVLPSSSILLPSSFNSPPLALGMPGVTEWIILLGLAALIIGIVVLARRS
jgi:hypothetical protein